MLTHPPLCQSGSPRKRVCQLSIPRSCAYCGKEYLPSHRKQTTCSLSCGAKLKAKVKTGCYEREKCARCHALVGMNGAMSGRLLGWSKAQVCIFRKKYGLKTLSVSEAVRGVNLLNGVTDAKWQKEMWEDEWRGVVDSYWDRMSAITMARMTNPLMCELSDQMIRYHLDIESSRRAAAIRSRRKYWSAPPGSNLRIYRKVRRQISRIYRKTKLKKPFSTVVHLGCSLEHARRHIEKQFKKGMSWGNHGEVWEIDHIIPMSLFDLKNPAHLLRVNHFTNLQPEWKQVNRKKGNRFEGAHQLALL
jgi:hypothetical protein